MDSVDDVQMFEDLLKSIGVQSFDPAVPIALNDYARRFAAELICDAKDYSVHRQSADIGVEDLKLAIKLCDIRVTGVDPRDSIVQSIKGQINRKDLVSMIDKESVLHRYPPDMFMQRSHTMVPGAEAYDEAVTDDPSTDSSGIDGNTGNSENNEMEVETTSAAVQSVQNVTASSLSHSSTMFTFNTMSSNASTIPTTGRGASKKMLETVPGFEPQEEDEGQENDGG